MTTVPQKGEGNIVAANEIARFEAMLTAFRGLVMIAAGLLASLFPREAFRFVLLAGGALLLIDGAICFASSDFSHPRGLRVWLTFARNLLSVVAGLALLAKYLLNYIFTSDFLAGFVGVLIVLAGLFDILSIFADPRRRASPMPAALGGGLYIVFGLMLVFVPLAEGATLIRIAAILIILYAPTLLHSAWQLSASDG